MVMFKSHKSWTLGTLPITTGFLSPYQFHLKGFQLYRSYVQQNSLGFFFFRVSWFLTGIHEGIMPPVQILKQDSFVYRRCPILTV